MSVCLSLCPVWSLCVCPAGSRGWGLLLDRCLSVCLSVCPCSWSPSCHSTCLCGYMHGSVCLSVCQSALSCPPPLAQGEHGLSVCPVCLSGLSVRPSQGM